PVGVQRDFVAVARRRPEAVDAARAQLAARDDVVQQLARVRVQLARGRALLRVIEERRGSPDQLPGREEERPVDVVDQLAERHLDLARAQDGGRGKVSWTEVGHEPLSVRLSESEEGLLLLAAVELAQLLLLLAVLDVELRALLAVDEARDHAARARRVQHAR